MIDLERKLTIKDNPTVVVPHREIVELEQENKRLEKAYRAWKQVAKIHYDDVKRMQIWASAWKQAAKKYRVANEGNIFIREIALKDLSIARKLASRCLELLRRIDKDLGFCPICKSHNIDWAGLKEHYDNCELARELKDDTD